MKFRGKIEDMALFHSINRLVTIFGKQHNEIVLRFNDVNMIFISKEVKQGVQIFAKIPARLVFIEYFCEGVSSEANEIYISLESEQFMRTLKQANKYTKSAKFKLTLKNGHSYLEIVFEQQTNLGSGNENINVSHGLPIEVLSRKEWAQYDKCVIQETNDIFYLPTLKHIKNVIDKQKTFDRYLNLVLLNGTLSLKVKNVLCEISTLYTEIEYKNNIVDREIRKSIEVDSNRLSTFLSSLNLNPTIKIETNLLDQHLINFQFTFEHIHVSFTLPHMLNG